MPVERLPRNIALVVLVLCACSPQPAGDILLITVDALRPDHLGLYGYERATSPNIDRHFSDAAIFERAYATNANTSPSVVSILDVPALTGPGLQLVYAASWSMGNSSLGTIISGAGGR